MLKHETKSEEEIQEALHNLFVLFLETDVEEYFLLGSEVRFVVGKLNDVLKQKETEDE